MFINYGTYENMIDQHKNEYGGGSDGDIVLKEGNDLNHTAGKYLKMEKN